MIDTLTVPGSLSLRVRAGGKVRKTVAGATPEQNDPVTGSLRVPTTHGERPAQLNLKRET